MALPYKIKQVVARPRDRCDMRPSRITTGKYHKTSQSISAVFDNIIVEWASEHFAPTPKSIHF